MPEARHWYLIAYDIRNEDRLRRVHKIMLAWGKAVQLSLFRTRLTNRELERMRFELSRVVESEDRLMFVRLCGSCAERVTCQGDMIVPFETDVPFCHIA